MSKSSSSKNTFEIPDKENNECFIIMPISDPPNYEQGHFKKIYEDIFIPACELADYKPIRADDVNASSLIHLDILKKLLESKMAICDLSSLNPNVLFELGIRQAFDKPTVLVQEKGTPSIFDIAPLKYCEYRKNHNYREVIEDQKKLAKYLKDTKKDLLEGKIVNSIVSLLSVGKPTVRQDTSNQTDLLYNYMISEINQLKNEFMKMSSGQVYSSGDSYGKILSSLEQLREMISSGTPNTVFNKNYSELYSHILNINDPFIRSVLLKVIEDIKGEGDKYI